MTLQRINPSKLSNLKAEMKLNYVMVYNYIIRPILLKHEKMIDDTVQKISQTATSHLTQITGNLTEKLVQEGIRRRHI
ncbi:hypothetical protein PFNF135_00578 [Plasmodium falciparum NF135/5.C10]|uniref:Uncharacterized protein n=1 Tax=Plasmodium falciparum NF135/5.C10 TaxID=1036726 RepID=W4IMT8_PLAFA|nr:hypothetical protein PFNF135_00578 [Plasmodium falciparum NF135/5.C10]